MGRKNFKRQFDQLENDDFSTPHSLALNERGGEICVGDREHGRILCYNTENGDFLRSIVAPKGSYVFGVAFEGDNLLAVTWPMPNTKMRSSGYVFDKEGKVMSTFNALSGLKKPHDVAASGNKAYAIELDAPYKLYKFIAENQ